MGRKNGFNNNGTQEKEKFLEELHRPILQPLKEFDKHI